MICLELFLFRCDICGESIPGGRCFPQKTKEFLYNKFLTRKLMIVKQHDVSTTSYHHCQMSKNGNDGKAYL